MYLAIELSDPPPSTHILSSNTVHALVLAVLLAVPPQQAQVEGEFLGAIVSYTEGHTGTEVVGLISHTARGLGHQHQGDQQDECSCHSDWWCHDIDGGKIISPST